MSLLVHADRGVLDERNRQRETDDLWPLIDRRLFGVGIARDAEQLLALEADDPELLGLGVGLFTNC